VPDRAVLGLPGDQGHTSFCKPEQPVASRVPLLTAP
jgi:hypothetical protein